MNEVKLEVKNKKDFLSVDKQTAISSEGDIFNIGDKVWHEGDKETQIGIITAFFEYQETADIFALAKLQNGREVRGRISFLNHYTVNDY